MSKHKNWPNKNPKSNKAKKFNSKNNSKAVANESLKYFSDIFSIEFYNRFKDNDLE